MVNVARVWLSRSPVFLAGIHRTSRTCSTTCCKGIFGSMTGRSRQSPVVSCWIPGGAPQILPEPLHDQVHVLWMFPCEDQQPLSPDIEEACIALLNPSEVKEYTNSRRKNTIKAGGRSMEWLLSRALLRSTMSNLVGGDSFRPQDVRFQRNPHGKPFLAQQEHLAPHDRIHFNITHSDSIIGLAVSFGRRVGLDAELSCRKTRADPLRLARRRFSPQEIEQLEAIAAACGPQAAERSFVDLWTLKEAYVKATGRGISAPPGLKGFSVGISPLQGTSKRPSVILQTCGQNSSTYPNGTVCRSNSAISFSSDLQEDIGRWRFLLCSPSPMHTASLCIETDAEEGPISVQMACVEIPDKNCVIRIKDDTKMNLWHGGYGRMRACSMT